MMSPLIRIALAINCFTNSHTIRMIMKYSKHLHILLKWILNFLFYPFYKLQDCKLSVCKYVSKSEEKIDCVVCLSKIKEKEEIMVLKCKHVFHRDCLDKWFRFKYNNTTCPLCRISVATIKDQIDDQVLPDDHCQVMWLR
ncbi:unnamed protein product [Trifolium pratense]|uniref:Uncharacterized protein n=1 Tax=Trifolium pratense TaxID=57577 RepID=A0ACB0JTU5_TRIPR|nr:unnamed protein product [Trifolium pratense]